MAEAISQSITQSCSLMRLWRKKCYHALIASLAHTWAIFRMEYQTYTPQNMFYGPCGEFLSPSFLLSAGGIKTWNVIHHCGRFLSNKIWPAKSARKQLRFSWISCCAEMASEEHFPEGACFPWVEKEQFLPMGWSFAGLFRGRYSLEMNGIFCPAALIQHFSLSVWWLENHWSGRTIAEKRRGILWKDNMPQDSLFDVHWAKCHNLKRMRWGGGR